MEPLVTAAQLVERSGGKISTEVAAQYAPAVSAMIRGLCGWHVAPVIDDEVWIGPPHAGPLHAPTLQLIEVKSLSVGGRPLQVRSWNRYGVINCEQFWSNDDVVAVIRHGFEKVPPEIVNLASLAALRAASSPLGVTREQLGAHSVSFTLTGQQSSGSLVVLESEMSMLAPYMLPGVP